MGKLLYSFAMGAMLYPFLIPSEPVFRLWQIFWQW